MKKTITNKRLFKHNDYRREIEVRALQTENPEEMIIEGKAVVFEEPTVLFACAGVEYKEIIKKTAFDEADVSDCFLKFNHSDHFLPVARVKNGTLELEVRDDGVYIRARLANTTAGRDLYELVKRGDLDKMSFAFTIKEESYDEKEHLWTVYKIDKLYDVAAVTVPAYKNTDLYARRYDDVEALRRQEVEALELARKKAQLKMQIYK